MGNDDARDRTGDCWNSVLELERENVTEWRVSTRVHSRHRKKRLGKHKQVQKGYAELVEAHF